MFPTEVRKIINEYTATSEKEVKIHFASCMKEVKYRLWLEDIKLYSLCFFPDAIEHVDGLEVVVSLNYKHIFKHFTRDLSV